MLIDLSVKVTRERNKEAADNEKIVSFGHLGTHFDVMNKEFPIEFVKRKCIVFNVKGISDKDICTSDIDINLVHPDMFIAFYTGYIEKYEYGTKPYFTSHPQLSDELIDQLLSRKISIIGIDCAGIRRGPEHTPKDQYCADRGVFVIENLCDLGKVSSYKHTSEFIINTYPVNFYGLTGLPCRVVAEI